MNVPRRHPPAPHHLLSPLLMIVPSGVEACDGRVPTPVVDLAVDLVGEQDHAVPARHFRQLLQGVHAVRLARGVGRVVQDHESGTGGIRATDRVQLGGLERPAVFRCRRDPPDVPSDDVSLGGVGDPARGRDHEIPVVGELEDEHQLLRAGADQDVLGGPLDAVAPCVVVRDRLSQRGKALYGEIFLFVGMGPQRLDHRLWNREGRLPEPETVDLSALGLQNPTPLVDGQGRRLVEPPDVEVEVDVRLGFRLGGHEARGPSTR